MNEQTRFEQHSKTLEHLMKKRNKAFLWGKTKRLIYLDRKIAELELELDDFYSISYETTDD